ARGETGDETRGILDRQAQLQRRLLGMFEFEPNRRTGVPSAATAEAPSRKAVRPVVDRIERRKDHVQVRGKGQQLALLPFKRSRRVETPEGNSKGSAIKVAVACPQRIGRNDPKARFGVGFKAGAAHRARQALQAAEGLAAVDVADGERYGFPLLRPRERGQRYAENSNGRDGQELAAAPFLAWQRTNGRDRRRHENASQRSGAKSVR